MVPFRPGVHALPSCAGAVDESGFSDLPEEAIVAMLLDSILGVVGSFSNIDVTTTTTGDLVRNTLPPTSAITGNTHRTLIPLRKLAIRDPAPSTGEEGILSRHHAYPPHLLSLSI